MQDKISLWWPNGYGNQTLYKLCAKWEQDFRDVTTNEIKQMSDLYLNSEKTVNIGFRSVRLIEDALEQGLSFYFEVNKVPMFMKGTNWIPSHILPEKSFNTKKIDHLLRSVADAHMNMMRVWGGGIYETNEFYNLADQYGILIWQDMMFACAMYPVYDDFLT